MPSFAVDSLRNLAAHHIPTDEAERKALYDAAQSLMYKVESGQDTAQRLYHGHLPLATAQTGMDLNLFRFLADHSNTSFSTRELANITGCEHYLLLRLLRFYASHGMVRQVDSDTFTASNITHNLALPSTAAGIKH
ncbi:uncharacterized protein LTR77_009153 [Saxophila tyrrhenica]|uniref:Uncharacterized protein n=1 Tax=Saxophila tyrrhenica TaxID=1690608 RepID=A0AAV9NYL9_9PEZI|nr:hypothetical protein LTR77_009153 [Saxophila tyrrhenica]